MDESIRKNFNASIAMVKYKTKNFPLSILSQFLSFLSAAAAHLEMLLFFTPEFSVNGKNTMKFSFPVFHSQRPPATRSKLTSCVEFKFSPEFQEPPKSFRVIFTKCSSRKKRSEDNFLLHETIKNMKQNRSKKLMNFSLSSS